MRLVHAPSLNQWSAPCRSVRDSSSTVPSADSTTRTMGEVLYTASTFVMVMGSALRFRRVAVYTAPHTPQTLQHSAASPHAVVYLACTAHPSVSRARAT